MCIATLLERGTTAGMSSFIGTKADLRSIRISKKNKQVPAIVSSQLTIALYFVSEHY